MHKALRDPATRTDTALALISMVKSFLTSRHVINDINKKVKRVQAGGEKKSLKRKRERREGELVANSYYHFCIYFMFLFLFCYCSLQIGWCLNCLFSNIKPFPLPATGIPPLLQMVDSIVRSFSKRLNASAKDLLSSLKQGKRSARESMEEYNREGRETGIESDSFFERELIFNIHL